MCFHRPFKSYPFKAGAGVMAPPRYADRGAFSILTSRGFSLFASLRYVWNATRGHRLAPWRSEYLRWRVETYSGQRAETLNAGSMFRFLWATRGELLGFLVWASRLKREADKTGTRERGLRD